MRSGPERPWHVTLWTGRHGDPVGDAVDEGLLETRVDDVLGALARLLAPAAAPA